MSDADSGAGAKQPGAVDRKNQDEASEANKRTVANVRKNEAEEEKREPQEYRPSS